MSNNPQKGKFSVPALLSSLLLLMWLAVWQASATHLDIQWWWLPECQILHFFCPTYSHKTSIPKMWRKSKGPLVGLVLGHLDLQPIATGEDVQGQSLWKSISRLTYTYIHLVFV